MSILFGLIRKQKRKRNFPFQLKMRLAITIIAVLHFACDFGNAALSEAEMRTKLAQYNTDALKLCNRKVKAGWNVATDIGNKEKETEQVFGYGYVWSVVVLRLRIESYDQNVPRKNFILNAIPQQHERTII